VKIFETGKTIYRFKMSQLLLLLIVKGLCLREDFLIKNHVVLQVNLETLVELRMFQLLEKYAEKSTNQPIFLKNNVIIE